MNKKRSFCIILSIAMTALRISFPGPVLAQTDGIESGYYGVDRTERLLGQVAEGTTEEEIFSRVLASGDLKLAGGVRTGSRLILEREGKEADSLTLSVMGDVNGDGTFSVTDMLAARASLLERRELTEAQRRAGDMSADGKLTETDVLRMKEALLGENCLGPHPVNGPAAEDSAVLAPGETMALGSENEKISVTGDAVTCASGRIRAVKTGCARVTAGGKTVWITVCDTPLRVRLPECGVTMVPGDRTALHPALNHPVSADLRWSVSDASVAEVDGNGVVTALKEGTVTVSAELPNGSKASQTVRILSGIRSIRFAEPVIKIRHGGNSKTLRPAIQPAESTEGLRWFSSDPSVAFVDANGRVTGLEDGLATITCVSKHGHVRASCTVKVCDLKQVALTFDDGPSDVLTGPMMDLLKKYGVHGTFFMVGGRIAKCDYLLKRMVNEGHELGYHTWSHSRLSDMTAGQIAGDFSWFQTAAKDACGQGATVFRAPYGDVRGSALGVVSVPHILWTVDTLDWLDRDPDLLCTTLLEAFEQDGVIILVHDIHVTTYEGVRKALAEMKERDMDVELLTVTDLLSRGGTPPKAGNTYRRAP